jgi:hypothetical protein
VRWPICLEILSSAVTEERLRPAAPVDVDAEGVAVVCFLHIKRGYGFMKGEKPNKSSKYKIDACIGRTRQHKRALADLLKSV